MAQTEQPKIQRWTDRRSIVLLTVGGACYISIFFVLAAWKYINFRYNALDLGIFTQTVSQTAAGYPFGLTIHPPSYLGDHFSPILFLLALPYRIFPHPLTLIFFLQLALAAGVYPLYRLSRRFISPGPALAVGLAYLLNPFTQNLSLFEFHAIAFAVPLLLFAVDAFQQKRFGHFLLWCTAALLVREDVALVVGAFALLALVERRRRVWVLAPALAAAAWLVLGFSIIHAASPLGNYKFSLYYAWLGENIPAIFHTILFRPLRWITQLLRIGNLALVAGLLLPFLFLPVAAPAALILAIGPLAQIALGAPGGGDLVLKTQYSALFLPGLWTAFIAALGWLSHATTIGPPWLKPFTSDRRLTVALLVTAVVYASLTLGPLPGALQKIFQQGWQNETARWEQTLVEKIPSAAPVVATYNFLPAVSSRPIVSSLNYAFIGRLQLSQQPYTLPSSTQYVLADLSEFLTFELQYRRHFWYAADYPAAAGKLRERLDHNGFAVTAVADRFIVMERGATSTIALYRVLTDAPSDLRGEPRAVGDGLHFLGYRIGASAPGPIPPDRQLPLELYWRSDGMPMENMYFHFIIDGKEQTTSYPLGSGLFPVPDWPAGSTIETNYWMAAPPVANDSRVALQLFTIGNGGLYLAPDLSTEPRVTKRTNVVPPIELGRLSDLK